MKNKTAKIYMVTNKVNGKRYIGFTVGTIKKRWNNHVCKATGVYKNFGNSNILFYNTIRKHGKDNFTIEMIYESENLMHTKDVMENFYILKYNTYYICGEGYNLTLGGEGTLGYKRTPEQIAAMSARNKGKKLSKETKEKLSIALSGKNNPRWGTKWSDELREKILNKTRGVKRGPLSEEHKRSIGEAHRGKIVSQETREKLRLFFTGRPGVKHTEEWKTNMSRIMTGRIFSEETLQKMSEVQLRYVYTLKNPNGDIITTKNITEYCDKNNLPRTTMMRAYKNKKIIDSGRAKGWELINIVPNKNEENKAY